MRTSQLVISAVLINLLFSYIMLLYNQPINVDGILYIHAAQAYLQNGFHAAAQIYAWPFYSVLLAKASLGLGLDFLNTGFILNSIFTSILIIFFILTLKSIENSPKLLLWGAAVILLLPVLNHDRYNILRDIPYYSFFIASFWSYLNFLKTQKNIYGLVWQIAMLSAVLFRIEGAAFLILTPLFSFLIPAENIKQKFIIFIKLFWLIIILGLFILICFRNSLAFGRIPELLSNINLFTWLDLIQQKIMGLRNYLGVVGQDDAGVFLISGLVGVLITSLISTLGILGCLIILYGLYKKLIPQEKPIKTSFLIYILINLIILAVFMAHQFFMNWRYVFPLALILLLYIPVILSKISYTKPGMILGMVYLIFNFAASFGQFGPSNSYRIEAGNWIDRNTPKNIRIYSTDETTAFYGHRVLANNINQADYIILINKAYDPNKINLKTQPVISFHNNRGDIIYILKK